MPRIAQTTESLNLGTKTDLTMIEVADLPGGPSTPPSGKPSKSSSGKGRAPAPEKSPKEGGRTSPISLPAGYPPDPISQEIEEAFKAWYESQEAGTSPRDFFAPGQLKSSTSPDRKPKFKLPGYVEDVDFSELLKMGPKTGDGPPEAETSESKPFDVDFLTKRIGLPNKYKIDLPDMPPPTSATDETKKGRKKKGRKSDE